MRGSKVLGIGVTYKPDVNDVRESPALAVLEHLAAEGATIAYHDPYVPSLELEGKTLRSKRLTPALLAGVDVAVVLAAHSTIDFGEVVKHAPLVFDVIDTWNERSLGGCTYHVAHPGGRNYTTCPVNAYEAEARRIARFFPFGHTPGRMPPPPEERNREFPYTLDLRYRDAC